MNTILVWFMVTVGGHNGNEVVYSPPMQDLEQCQWLQKSVKEISSTTIRSRCIQIKMAVTK